MVVVFTLLSLHMCWDGLEVKLMNIWMCGYDDHLMCNLCLVFYSSCESRLCYYCYEHYNGYFRVMHWWLHKFNIKELITLPMYPNVNAWIAKVRSLMCSMKLACLLCYYMLCGLFLVVNHCPSRVSVSICCRYPSCVHIDQCTHTLTLYACLQVT